jgi:mono/diheme cytochrome c family protein
METARATRRRAARIAPAGAILALVAWSVGQAIAQGNDAQVARGKELYAQLKCSICHVLGGKGGRSGPALDDAGKKLPPDKMEAFLKAPSSVNPRSAMPPTRGSADDIRALAAYMNSLGAAPVAAAPEASIAWGHQLFASKHCFYCHQIGTKGGKLGPALDQAQQKNKRTREFLIAHFKNPAAATPGSTMPALDATEPEVQSLAYYVESLKPGASVPTIVLPAPGEGGKEPSVVEGEALYYAVACSSCHAVGPKGTHVGPALDAFGASGRKEDWIIGLFQNPDQTAPGTTMPTVQGTDRQLKSLALYLLTLKTQVTPTPEIGGRVYVQRDCAACHGAKATGTKLGPSLRTQAMQGRTDAWILEHLKDPAAVTPGSNMPRIWASDWEMQSLLNYLKQVRTQAAQARARGTAG